MSAMSLAARSPKRPSDILQEGALGAGDVNAVATSEREAGRDQLTVLVWNYHDDDLAAESANTPAEDL